MNPINMMSTRLLRLIPGVLGASLLSTVALADGTSALKQAPPSANAVMTIDVAKLMQSPLGKAEGLQGKLMTGFADRPLAVPATAKYVTLVAGVHPVDMESIWQVAIVELSAPPRIEAMVGAQGGYLDTIEGKPAAWTKRDTYYIQLDNNTMGVVRPAQRQFVSRWMAKKNESSLSSYLTNALTSGADADATFAVDLDGVFAAAGTRFALRMGELPSLEKMDPAKQSKLLTALATVKGMKITMRATDKINAEWVVDFGEDVSGLGSDVEQFVIDCLTAGSVYDGNADKWNFKATGRQIVGKGTMDLDGLARLVGLLSPGDLSAPAATGNVASASGEKASDTTPAKSEDPKNAAAVASQKYFRAISKSLDGIAMKISPTQGAAWLSSQARTLDQLPVLNVDPALLAWGNQVVDAYRRAGQELAMGQMNAKNAVLGVAAVTGTTTTDSDGNSTGVDTADSRAAFANARQERQQVAQQQRMDAAGRAIKYFNEIAPMRSQLRVEMTQKYGVEF